MKYKTPGEAYNFVSKVYRRLSDMVDQDDGSNPERSKRLKIALERIDGALDGIESYWECYD